MHGNVYEWCLDWRIDTPVAWERKDGVDPVGAVSGTLRIRRGGTWTHGAASCRSAARGGLDPTRRTDIPGLRLVMHLP